MTDKQMSYLMSLIQSRVVPMDLADVNLGTLTSFQASMMIDRMKAQPLKASSKAPEGYYRVDGEVYTVCEGKSGNTYAKVLVHKGRKGSWEYAKGMVYRLKPENRITLEEARAFGKLHGFCLVCGRTLTDPKSVEAGIGPVCANRV